MGKVGTGTLTINSGGLVSGIDGFIAQSSGATGTVNVHDPGSVWTMSNALYVGGNGTEGGGIGTINVDNDGRVLVAKLVKVWPTGVVDVNSSGAISVGGEIQSDGTLTGTGTLAGHLSVSGGTVAPGSPTGILSVDGDCVFGSGGTLSLEIAGTDPGVDHDRLAIAGTVDIDGTLSVSLRDGFVPTAGEEFEVMTFSSRTGTFPTVVLPELAGDDTFTVHYESTRVLLRVSVPSRLYVRQNATGANNGTSWAGALVSLQDALDLARSSSGVVEEIWVAEGYYTPDDGEGTTPGDRSATFQLINGVGVYGGFSGTETLRSQRDPSTNITTLGGDLNGDDVDVACTSDLPDCLSFGGVCLLDGGSVCVTRNNMGENSRHIVSAAPGVDNTAVLDGFLIHSGNADGASGPDDVGGGVWIDGASPRIVNCQIGANRSAVAGAGVNSNNGDPVVERCLFDRNSAAIAGALNVHMGSATCRSCVFQRNYANDAGAVEVTADVPPGFLNCMFLSNTAAGVGGAFRVATGSAKVINCTFSNNRAGTGGTGPGGDFRTDSSVQSTIANSIFWTDGVLPEDRHISVGGSGGVAVTYTLVQGLSAFAGGVGNIDADPLFVNDHHLSTGSPCIDAGSNAAIMAPNTLTLDLDGNPRRYNDPATPDTGQGVPPVVDMGAYEFFDCNGNDIPDDVDLSSLTSSDCNANAVPDECESGCESASASDVGDGETVIVNPGGGSGNLDEDSVVVFTNESGGSGASITVNETTDPIQSEATAFSVLGNAVLIDTSLANGDFLMTISVPFDLADLGGEDPLSVDLIWFDGVDWVLAVSGDTQDSPGHATREGDRFAESGAVTPTLSALSADLGDYGVFWNIATLTGFTWANVDHASVFSSALPVVAPQAPTAEPGVIAKNRFISFVIPSDGVGVDTAVRVELTSLHHPAGPPNAPNFSAFEGQYRYLNAIRDADNNPVYVCPDSTAFGTSYNCAKLGCSPEYRDWAGIFGGQVVHVTGDSVVPSSQFAIAQLAASCAGNEVSCAAASAELAVSTERWGNVDGNPAGGAPSATDISRIVDKVKDVPTAFIEPRCQLRDATPNPYGAPVNAQDIGRIVDAVKGQPYTFTITACP